MDSPLVDVSRLAEKLIASLADGFSLIDADGQQLLVNDEMCRITGFRREQLIGTRPPHPYWPPEELDTILGAFDSTLRGGLEPLELTFMRADGERFPALLHPARWIEDGHELFFTTVKDISHLRRHESLLARSQHLLDTMLRRGDLAYWDWHLIEGWTRVSDSYFTMLGYSPDAWPASYEAWTRRVHPDDIGRADHSLRRLLDEQERLYDAEFRVRDADGQWRWVLARGYVTERDAHGKPTRITGTHQDIHHLKSQEQQLRQLQKMEVLGQLTGGIAHDLNNILAVAYGQLDQLQFDASPGQVTEIDQLFGTLQRAADLTTSLLRFARPEESPTERVDVREFLSKAPTLLARTGPLSDVLEIALPDRTCAVEVDPRGLENALLSLVLNARDALRSSAGSIRLTAHLAQGASRPAPRMVIFTVTDDGCGMTPETLAQACDPLFSTKPRGSGMGLCTAQQFAVEAGGDLQLHSAPGEGTRAELALPAAPLPRLASQSRADERAARDEFRGSGTVLVVDDQPDLLTTLEAQIEGFGYTVLRAGDPRRALALLRDQPIDLLFTDIVMPHTVDGLELARRAVILQPGIDVLFMTGYADDTVEQAARELGEVLRKPFTARQLGQALQDRWAGRRAAPPAT